MTAPTTLQLLEADEHAPLPSAAAQRILLAYTAAATRNLPAALAQLPLPQLMAALATVGWGSLAGRTSQGPRALLRALAVYSGPATLQQLATASGLSERWTLHCLDRLQHLGYIEPTPDAMFTARRSALAQQVVAAWRTPGHQSRLRLLRELLSRRHGDVPCPAARELRSLAGLTRTQWRAGFHELRRAGLVRQHRTSGGWRVEALLPRSLRHEAAKIASRETKGQAWESDL